jgi:hypothetical protein
MSDLLNGVDYGLLFSNQPNLNASSAILNALYSTSPAPSTFASTGNPLTDLKLAQADQTADVAKEAQQPQVYRAIAAFKTAVASSKTIQDALANPNVQQVLLTANNLASYIGETALVQKAFLSNLTDPSSLVNKMGDGTLLSAVTTYNFAQTGLAELQNPSVVSTLANAYAEIQWRQSLDQSTPGLSNALDFLDQASSIKSVNDILDNSTNFYVITGALGISPNIVFQDQTAQVSAITSRLDIAKLQDRSYVTTLTDQYLLSQQTQSGSSASASTSLLV